MATLIFEFEVHIPANEIELSFDAISKPKMLINLIFWEPLDECPGSTSSPQEQRLGITRVISIPLITVYYLNLAKLVHNYSNSFKFKLTKWNL